MIKINLLQRIDFVPHHIRMEIIMNTIIGILSVTCIGCAVYLSLQHHYVESSNLLLFAIALPALSSLGRIFK